MLWEQLLPEEAKMMPPELVAVDGLLDDPRFFDPFRRWFDPVWGRPSIGLECDMPDRSESSFHPIHVSFYAARTHATVVISEIPTHEDVVALDPQSGTQPVVTVVGGQAVRDGEIWTEDGMSLTEVTCPLQAACDGRSRSPKYNADL